MKVDRYESKVRFSESGILFKGMKFEVTEVKVEQVVLAEMKSDQEQSNGG